MGSFGIKLRRLITVWRNLNKFLHDERKFCGFFANSAKKYCILAREIFWTFYFRDFRILDLLMDLTNELTQ